MTLGIITLSSDILYKYGAIYMEGSHIANKEWALLLLCNKQQKRQWEMQDHK